MNQTRDAHVLKRFMAAEHCDCFVSPVAFYHLFPNAGALLALKLSRKLSVHAVALCSSCANHAPHHTAHVVGRTWYATSTALAAAASTAAATMRSPTAPAAASTAMTAMHSPVHGRLR